MGLTSPPPPAERGRRPPPLAQEWAEGSRRPLRTPPFLDRSRTVQTAYNGSHRALRITCGNLLLQIRLYIITMKFMDNLLEFAVHCARESGKIQRRYYEKHFAIHHKGEINLVTDVDFACQERIIKLIQKDFPKDNIISEEQLNRFDGKANRWIIDPLDGTTNYAHGYPFFCTSIAYEVQGNILLGVVYNPIFKELFVARKGQGAYLNGRKIHVSAIGDLKKSLLSTGFPYDHCRKRKKQYRSLHQFSLSGTGNPQGRFGGIKPLLYGMREV